MLLKRLLFLMSLMLIVQPLSAEVEEGFGGASVSQSLFNFIRKILPEGSTLLEFGSGWASGEFSKYYSVYSVEHDAQWVNKYKTHYIHAPIVGNWYDTSMLKGKLPAKYDLILVDGPPGYDESQPGRYGLMQNLELFNTNVPIIVDDVNREGELKLLKDLAVLLKRPYEIITCDDKAFGYIAK